MDDSLAQQVLRISHLGTFWRKFRSSTGEKLTMDSSHSSRVFKLKLTYSSDRLRAFAGIIRRMAANNYKAGFYWGLPVSDPEKNLDWDFQWNADQERQVERLPEFPSWPWAG
jgi:hypothetical protein